MFDALTAPALAEIKGLLDAHYVADGSGNTRLIYPPAFLHWILGWPGARPDWRVGVRFEGRLIGFVAAMPCALRYRDDARRAAFVNLLCVHQDWRSRGLAPALIREVTRRVMVAGSTVAAYTRSRPQAMPPLSSSNYRCRPLNIERLARIGYVHPRCPPPPLARIDAALDRFGPVDMAMDISVCTLLEHHGAGHVLHRIFSTDEIAHCSRTAPDGAAACRARARTEAGDVVAYYSYCVHDQQIALEGAVETLRCAALYHHAANPDDQEEMLVSAMAHALHADGCDLFFALPIMGLPASLLARLHFRSTDASVFHYLFNWGNGTHSSEQIGLPPI